MGLVGLDRRYIIVSLIDAANVIGTMDREMKDVNGTNVAHVKLVEVFSENKRNCSTTLMLWTCRVPMNYLSAALYHHHYQASIMNHQQKQTINSSLPLFISSYHYTNQ